MQIDPNMPLMDLLDRMGDSATYMDAYRMRRLLNSGWARGARTLEDIDRDTWWELAALAADPVGRYA